MKYETFKEEFEGARFTAWGMFYFAHTDLVTVRYDPKLDYYDILERHIGNVILDGVDLRIAKAFITLNN